MKIGTGLCRMRILRVFLLTFFMSALPLSAAIAQQLLPPKEQYYIGEGEVELFRGTFSYSNTDIGVGQAESPAQMSLQRYYAIRDRGGPFGYSSGHSQEVRLYRHRYIEDPNGPGQWSYTYYVVIGRTLETFDEGYGNGFISYIGSSPGTQVLTKSSAGGPFTYTGPNCQPARDLDPRSASNIDPAIAMIPAGVRNVAMGVCRRRA